ncbi:MAG: RNA degradosome polyphosphate kinase, partial [Candidatus Limnocylindrales bacterium]
MSATRSARAENRLTRLRRVPTKAGLRYINRELSWLDWNARVLYQAKDPRNPLLERVKFLAIFANNLDEFFQVRVAGLRQQAAARSARLSPDGLSAAEQLERIRPVVRDLVAEHSAAFAEIRKALTEQGVAIVKYAKIPQH